MAVRRAYDEENECAFKDKDKRAITHEDFPLLSWKHTYFKVAAAWRASQVTTVTLWFALCTCAFKGWALLAGPLIVVAFTLRCEQTCSLLLADLPIVSPASKLRLAACCLLLAPCYLLLSASQTCR